MSGCCCAGLVQSVRRVRRPEPLTEPDALRVARRQQRSAEATGGVTLTGVRLYHPDTGRFLQVDPVSGARCNDYDYASAPILSAVGGALSARPPAQ